MQADETLSQWELEGKKAAGARALLKWLPPPSSWLLVVWLDGWLVGWLVSCLGVCVC